MFKPNCKVVSIIILGLPILTGSLHSQEPQQTSGGAKLNGTSVETLKNANWQVTEGVRGAFLAEAEKTILADLDKALPADFLNWVRSDAEVYSAVFGSVSPADTRILLNLHQLYSELDSNFIGTYKHLVLGAAVARRRNGVGPFKGFHKFTSMLEKSLRAEGDFHKNIKPGKKSTYSPEQLEKARIKREKIAAQALAYIKKKGLTAREAYEDKVHRAAIADIARANQGGRNPDVNKILEQALILMKKRPAERDSFPPVSAFFKYLAAHYETPAAQLKLPPKAKWPLFAIDKTPWPLLMPLSKTWPLREADYIWEKYQGQHGGKSYHTYGPYSREHKARGLEPDPSWHWQAWPSRIKQGGLCGTMSSIATGTYTALGKPSMKAGQPGHSCIVLYHRSADGYFSAGVGQSVKGAFATKTAWPFSDATAWRNINKAEVKMEYHSGLALAMNIGLSNYLDTRLAVHMYRQLSDTDRSAHGARLLRNALKQNPYNVELWYLLMENHCASLDDTYNLVNLLRKHVASSAKEAVVWVEREVDEDLSDRATPTALPPERAMTTYANIVAQVILDKKVGHPAGKSREDAKTALAYLEKQRKEFGLKDLSPTIFQYEIAVNGVDIYKKSVKADLLASLAPTKKGKRGSRNAAKRANKKVTAGITGIHSMLEPAECIPWLEELRTLFPENCIVINNGKKGIGTDVRYFVIHNLLVKELTNTNQQKRAKQLESEHKKRLAKGPITGG